MHGVLFFDEADALFGKRSEVRDAHDRYANVEVAYLLQRMESFDGIAILATNLRANIDEAFARRLDAVVDFPSPDEGTASALGALPPASSPRGGDVDLEFLRAPSSSRVAISATSCLCAAFLAAMQAGRDDGRSHPRRRDEYRKLGRMCTASEFGPTSSSHNQSPCDPPRSAPEEYRCMRDHEHRRDSAAPRARAGHPTPGPAGAGQSRDGRAPRHRASVQRWPDL